MNKKSLTINYLLLLVVSIIWGAQFLLNKLALQSFSSIEIAFLRAFIGMLTLTVLLNFSKIFTQAYVKKSESAGFHRKTFVIGLFEATLPFLLVAWGQQYIDSAVASILIGTIPIFTIVILLFLPKEKVSIGSVISIILGFIAIIVLLSPDINVKTISLSLLGMAAVLIGAFSFAISLILIKHLPSVSPVFAARSILFWASVQMLPFVLWKSSFTLSDVNISSLSSMIILGVFCAGIIYVLFIMLINKAGPAFASFSNYLVPVVGVILGIVFFQEKLSLTIIIALLLILIALLINEFFSRKINKI